MVRRRTSDVLSFNVFEFYLYLEFSKIYEIFSWFVMTTGRLWTPLNYFYCIKDCVEFVMRLLRRFEIDFIYEVFGDYSSNVLGDMIMSDK